MIALFPWDGTNLLMEICKMAITVIENQSEKLHLYKAKILGKKYFPAISGMNK